MRSGYGKAAAKLAALVMVSIITLVSGLAVPQGSIALADGPVEARNGRAEVRFLEGMMDHHQMALDMAGDCLKKAATPDVVALCNAIITSQSAEIAQMKGWLKAWYTIDYQPISMMGAAPITITMSGHEGHDMATMPAMDGLSMGVDPVGMMGMMAGLDKLSGKAYETAWLESMIDHHDDAIHMAKRLLPRAEHPDLKTLADKIINAQTGEIDQMEALLKTLGSA